MTMSCSFQKGQLRRLKVEKAEPEEPRISNASRVGLDWRTVSGTQSSEGEAGLAEATGRRCQGVLGRFGQERRLKFSSPTGGVTAPPTRRREHCTTHRKRGRQHHQKGTRAGESLQDVLLLEDKVSEVDSGLHGSPAVGLDPRAAEWDQSSVTKRGRQWCGKDVMAGTQNSCVTGSARKTGSSTATSRQ